MAGTGPPTRYNTMGCPGLFRQCKPYGDSCGREARSVPGGGGGKSVSRPPCARQLRACLGRHHDVSSAQILCGNGASDLIDRLVLALRPKRGDGNCAGVFRVWPSAEAGGLSSGGVSATGRGFSDDSADFGAHYACIGYFISL